MNAHNVTGYGPRHRIIFDGDDRRYELWEVKFLGYMKLCGLDEVLKNLDLEGHLNADETKNAEVSAELSLIIRDAENNGRSAMKILRRHYRPKGKPRVITLCTELTSLMKSTNESVTDYLIRAETACASLKNAGEAISDSLLIAMTLKGLPSHFKSFTTVVTQKEQQQRMTFTNFKIALRNYEDTEKFSPSQNLHLPSWQVNMLSTSPRLGEVHLQLQDPIPTNVATTVRCLTTTVMYADVCHPTTRN
ncbi:CCHC-type zinc finger, nucleic acid binding protein a [Elysia marginata]|uniref:CCHC-type zinc finger, nucleic acid binding protein a n=1 Tax=Elysia marginata TaxID=1093978 RepID=A0AAV4ED01_9GAST|nr:CCHC-type zinc finger, nucleic acid binding protein a [Elysia marginata]